MPIRYNHLLITTIPNYNRLVGIEKFKAEDGKYSLLFHTDKMSTPAFGILYHHGGADMLKLWEPGHCITSEILTSDLMADMLVDFPKLINAIDGIRGISNFSTLLQYIGNCLPPEFYAYGRSYYGADWNTIRKKTLPKELFYFQDLKAQKLAPIPVENNLSLF